MESKLSIAQENKAVAVITIDIDPQGSKEFIAKLKQQNNTPCRYADAQAKTEIIKK